MVLCAPLKSGHKPSSMCAWAFSKLQQASVSVPFVLQKYKVLPSILMQIYKQTPLCRGHNTLSQIHCQDAELAWQDPGLSQAQTQDWDVASDRNLALWHLESARTCESICKMVLKDFGISNNDLDCSMSIKDKGQCSWEDKAKAWLQDWSAEETYIPWQGFPHSWHSTPNSLQAPSAIKNPHLFISPDSQKVYD